ncbi:Tyrosine recombinase XerD [Labeo rohita]|uniref:Tyrosine recombinase XerD n=1 Tax=Labeo rohita TaxID=84645 RepID=A0ABQ8LYN9_LABRO|nr:Tyrosine recombinase XerD [Labeo rohita]
MDTPATPTPTFRRRPSSADSQVSHTASTPVSKVSPPKASSAQISSPLSPNLKHINSLIPREEFSLHYHNVDQAITLIKDAGRGAWLAKVNITSAFKLFSELGIPLVQDKTEGPSTSIEFLAINLDSQKFQTSLPQEKIDRTVLVASTLLTNSSCSKHELLSILGHLNFAMRIIPNLISSPIDIQLYTDAAPSVGFGGFFRGRWFASKSPPHHQLADLPQQLSSSALFELYPLVATAFLWGKEWSATSIVVHCDNEATVHCINKEIQIAGTRGRPAPNPSFSLLRTDIPVNHPLKPLLEASINSILQAVSPRTLQSYLTAWKRFKTFHSAYSLPFPDFSLLSITSFISHLNINKTLQISSIKGYLSGIQFFHKLLYGSPSPQITNSQTPFLIKGIQKTHPNHPDPRQPITLKSLTKCISTLRKGYDSIHTALTLDAMFILAFFGFLRCSELTITSGFNPAIHPTISDLAVLGDESISYFIKQNDFKRPTTHFWFQKHLKSILLLSGTPADNFSSHSFRIGATTTAAQKDLSQQQIQALGRRSSTPTPFNFPSATTHPCFDHPLSIPLQWEPLAFFPALRHQRPLPQELHSQVPTAAAAPTPAGAPSFSPYCHSSARPRRSSITVSQCRSSARSCWSPFPISLLPQQCLLPQEPHS